MKASKFSDAQKVFILKQGEQGAPVAETCRNGLLPVPWTPPQANSAIRSNSAGLT